jgi:hypothetical protein
MRTHLFTSITQTGYAPYSNADSGSDAETAQPERKEKNPQSPPGSAGNEETTTTAPKHQTSKENDGPTLLQYGTTLHKRDT